MPVSRAPWPPSGVTPLTSATATPRSTAFVAVSAKLSIALQLSRIRRPFFDEIPATPRFTATHDPVGESWPATLRLQCGNSHLIAPTCAVASFKRHVHRRSRTVHPERRRAEQSGATPVDGRDSPLLLAWLFVERRHRAGVGRRGSAHRAPDAAELGIPALGIGGRRRRRRPGGVCPVVHVVLPAASRDPLAASVARTSDYSRLPG